MTPDEWLLAKYDRLADDPGRIPHNHERPMFEVLDDHPGTDCRHHAITGRDGSRWPMPFKHNDLDEHDRQRGRAA